MKLLMVLSRFPYPLEKGDKLRAYHQIKYLSRKHDIYLVALTEKTLPVEVIAKVKPFCKELHIVKLTWWSKVFHIITFFFRGLPIQCGYFYSHKAQRLINKLRKRVNPDHVYGQMVRVAEYIKKMNVKKTIDYQDVLSKGFYRRAKTASFCKKILFNIEYKRLRRYEKSIFSYFDHHTIITGVDRDLIEHPDFKKIHVVANGVDFDTYVYKGEKKEYDLIFTGNMSYAPNIDAAEYLVKEILPILRMNIPDIKLVICGADPSYKVKQLAGEQVTVTGWVDSIADYYAKSKIFIAPMQLGTGLQNKILEAMAIRLPCITSTLAGKPLENVIPGKEILICNSVTGYVEAIRLLLENPEHYKEISEQGYLFVRKNYNWESTTAKLEEIMFS